MILPCGRCSSGVPPLPQAGAGLGNIVITGFLPILFEAVPVFVQNTQTVACGDTASIARLLVKLNSVSLLLSDIVPTDKHQAVEFYQQACDGDYAPACLALAFLYNEGEGVKEDKQRAAEIYQKACEKNNAEACPSVGFMSYQGDGIRGDAQKNDEALSEIMR